MNEKVISATEAYFYISRKRIFQKSNSHWGRANELKGDKSSFFQIFV